jgi:hypothetical protein
MTDSTPQSNETQSMSADNEYNELITPDYEGHYQKLVAAIKTLASAEKPSLWAIVTGGVGLAYLERYKELEAAYCGDAALLATQLVYIDLGALGIPPSVARLIILARLLSDEAPMSHLRDETNVAIADVIESLAALTMSSDTVPAFAKPLFSVDMWPIASTDTAPQPEEKEAAPLVAAATRINLDKWFAAMATQGAA